MEIPVVRNALEANDRIAARLRDQFNTSGVLALNLISSPGSGKTSLLERTLGDLAGEFRMAVIEGDLEESPDNVLIYATSNRRHLIHEGFKDKLDRGENDDIHESDTVEEKLSLYHRFGMTIYYGKPTPKEFKNIVRTLAERYAVDMDDEELLLQANRWEIEHGGLSGRTAKQFIDHVMSIE